jgi:hypothetical protein
MGFPQAAERSIGPDDSRVGLTAASVVPARMLCPVKVVECSANDRDD